MPVFKADFSEAGIEKLIQQVSEYQRKVEALSHALAGRLAESGREKIERNLSSITDRDGNVLANAGVQVLDSIGIAFLEGEQAGYLEYGTGVQGQSAPHPLASEVGWSYNSGSMIHVTKSGRIGWVYREEETGKYHFTDGIPAQMPVYAAAQELRGEVIVAAKEVLK